MAGRTASSFFSVLVGLSSCLSTWALRETAPGKNIAMLLADCPPEVVLAGKTLAGKQQCVAVDTDKFVPIECCQEIQDCRDTLVDLSSSYLAPLNAIMQGCNPSPEDVAALSTGDMEHFNASSVCKTACQDAVAALPPLPDFEAFTERCHSKLMLGDVQTLEGVETQRKMVEAFLDAAQECIAEQPVAVSRQPKKSRKKKSRKQNNTPKKVLRFTSDCLPRRKAECPRDFMQVARKRCTSFSPFSFVFISALARFRVTCEKHIT